MKRVSVFKSGNLLCGLLVFLFSAAVSAQGSENSDYHPLMTSKFNLGLGAFFPQKTFEISVDGSVPGENIDFDETLNMDESETTLSVDFRWRYTKNWSFWAQYWAIDSQDGTVLQSDVTWEDTTFLADSFVNSGVKTTIARLFFGRSFLHSSPRHELGLGRVFTGWRSMHLSRDGLT